MVIKTDAEAMGAMQQLREWALAEPDPVAATLAIAEMMALAERIVKKGAVTVRVQVDLEQTLWCSRRDPLNAAAILEHCARVRQIMGWVTEEVVDGEVATPPAPDH